MLNRTADYIYSRYFCLFRCRDNCLHHCKPYISTIGHRSPLMVLGHISGASWPNVVGDLTSLPRAMVSLHLQRRALPPNLHKYNLHIRGVVHSVKGIRTNCKKLDYSRYWLDLIKHFHFDARCCRLVINKVELKILIVNCCCVELYIPTLQLKFLKQP